MMNFTRYVKRNLALPNHQGIDIPIIKGLEGKAGKREAESLDGIPHI